MTYFRNRGFERVSQAQWELDAKHYLKNRNPIIPVEEIFLPQRATENSAGYDIFSPIDFILKQDETIGFPLGFKSYMLSDEVLKIYARSGLGFKFIRLANGTGIIDSDYYNNKSNEGHCAIKLRNEGYNSVDIKKGSAIAQGIFQKYLIADDDTPKENVRVGGFGSSDKK